MGVSTYECVEVRGLPVSGELCRVAASQGTVGCRCVRLAP